MDPSGDDDEGDITCPMSCTWCADQGDGACEDCLPCLFWPRPAPTEKAGPSSLPGRTSPVLSDVLARERAQITLGRRIGLVLRRHRRENRHSQRETAQEIGWSRSALARAEVDAAALPLHKVEALLALTGHRLAIVPETVETASALGEESDVAWGVPDLVARDAGRRRLPTTGAVRLRSSTERLVDGRGTGHEGPWVWTRAR